MYVPQLAHKLYHINELDQNTSDGFFRKFSGRQFPKLYYPRSVFIGHRPHWRVKITRIFYIWPDIVTSFRLPFISIIPFILTYERHTNLSNTLRKALFSPPVKLNWLRKLTNSLASNRVGNNFIGLDSSLVSELLEQNSRKRNGWNKSCHYMYILSEARFLLRQKHFT